ncbi:MAG: 3-deoxy-D-manno-octulosonic acid transferase [Caulobacterales bacterium]
MSLPFTLSLYRAGMTALSPLAPLWLGYRARSGKEDGARLAERFGRGGGERPTGPLVWLHGASVGEMGVILQLQEALAARVPALNFLVTTGTRTSAELFQKRAPVRTHHAYAPLDTPGAVKRFFDRWRPDLGVMAESELWPNLILEASARRVPLALINARMSPKTLSGWARQKETAHCLLNAFALILAADARTADALIALTGKDVRMLGNLKLAAAAPRVDAQSLAALTREIGARPVWLAASTHEGEEEILLDAHWRLLAERADALLVIAPRHPERGAKISALANNAPRRSKGDAIGGGSVYIADTMGELGALYAAAPVSFIGGSLTPDLKGHNPIEPAKIGSAILTGPFVESFQDSYDLLQDHGGARTVSNAAEIAAAVAHLWSDQAARDTLTRSATRAAEGGGAALEETCDALVALMSARQHARA